MLARWKKKIVNLQYTGSVYALILNQSMVQTSFVPVYHMWAAGLVCFHIWTLEGDTVQACFYVKVK